MSSSEITNRQMTPTPATVEVHEVPPQENPSHSSALRASENYSYSDSFETSTFKQETANDDYQTTSPKQEDDYSASDYEDDFVSYADTFESGSSVLNSDKSSKESSYSATDTKSESSAFCSGVLNKETVFHVSEFGIFQDLLVKPKTICSTSHDTSLRFEREIKDKTEQKISPRSLKEQKEKEDFVKKCLQRIQDPPKTSEQNSLKYDDGLKHFLDNAIAKVSEKTLQDSKPISKKDSKSRSEIKREKLLGSKFEAPPIALAKIKMKNLMDSMDEASAVRIHDPKKCNTCKTHHKQIEASVARERFIRCKVNDLTRKKTEIKIEDHLIETANLCL